MTVSKFPAAISSASAFLPVGLIRSPITTNGRSKPITTSLVADDKTSRLTPLSFPLAPDEPLETSSSCTPASSQSSLLRDLRLEIVAAVPRLAPPLLEVASVPISPARIAAASIASWNRGGAHARARATFLRRHLRGDVAPPDDRQLRHGPARRRTA